MKRNLVRDLNRTAASDLRNRLRDTPLTWPSVIALFPKVVEV